MSFGELITSLQKCAITDEQVQENVKEDLNLFYERLLDSSRSTVKRSKERCLEEAVQLLKRVSKTHLLFSLEESHLLLLIQVLISLQLETVGISTACGKIDQMLHELSDVNEQLVFTEIKNCLQAIAHKEQLLSLDDLQRACMFLEDSAVGREVWKELCLPLMQKVAQLFTVVLKEEPLRDGLLCYSAVKLCLQTFQLLPNQVSSVVWTEMEGSQVLQHILQALLDIIYGQCCNRDTCLLAGTAVAMMLNSSQNQAAGHAAWNLLQISNQESGVVTVGGLQVNCRFISKKELAVLAVSRGVLTCCRPHVLLSSNNDNTEVCLLLNGLFPVIISLCEEKLNCHYFAFEVLTLWLKKVKENLAEIMKTTGARLLSDSSGLQQQLIHIVLSNADSPVDGVSEMARSAFALLLDLYQMDYELCNDAERTLYSSLLYQITKFPWENKAKYYQLCALLPYLGSEKVLSHYSELPNHMLKCLSTNHLSPCGSELYKCLIQQQRQELSSQNELYLVDQWAKCWKSVLIEALTSEVAFLQNNCSIHLLPSTFRVFPSAVEPLLRSLDTSSPGHLYAWACVLSSYRATTGQSPWTLQGGTTLKILHLALESADDKVRLAAFSLLCCSPKTKDFPTQEELELIKGFIPQNLNCESSSFRQHFQNGVRRFLVRIRDCCLSFVKIQNGKKKQDGSNKKGVKDLLDQGTEFVDWLGELPYCYLAAGHSYQRKKTSLLVLTAVLETCTATWSPDKKKGQPPMNMDCLIKYIKQKGQWNFFSRAKLLVLISCLEDATNEIRELASYLLMRFFPCNFPKDISTALFTRTKQLLCSPRVQEAQMGALMIKVLHPSELCGSNFQEFDLVRFLFNELEEHYCTAKSDMMLAARTKPIHGVLSALQRCLFDSSSNMQDKLDSRLILFALELLENISLLLLGVLYGDQEGTGQDVPPSFCDMGNAITSLIDQASGGGHSETDECVLLSEEHSLVLTCCWVSLKEIGIFLGSLVDHVFTQCQGSNHLLTKTDLKRASRVFWNILLKCRQWGAVEGCCIGFTKFCACLLRSNDPELNEIPTDMLKQVLQVIASPRSTSVTRRAAGLPMLILCVLSAEVSSKGRPLLAYSLEFLLETAKASLPEQWDQTLDLPQVCAVHTLQALVRGTALGSAVLQFSPTVAILSLTLLSSSCWAMRNAALQLYSSLCCRMLGHCPSNGDDKSAQNGMSSTAFFCHYSALQPFLLAELREAAHALQSQSNEARLHLKPSLFPILTLLAQLHPSLQDSAQSLSGFVPPLLQLSASPIYNVRAMASRALVAITPPSENIKILLTLAGQLPGSQQRYSHNWLHGHLLQIKALFLKAVGAQSVVPNLHEAVNKVEASIWLATEAQRCPLVKMAYVEVVETITQFCSEHFLSQLHEILTDDLQKPQHEIQIGRSSFHQTLIRFLCTNPLWASHIWKQFDVLIPDVRLALIKWAVDGCSLHPNKELIHEVLQENLQDALLSKCVEYRHSYLKALVTLATSGEILQPQLPLKTTLKEPVLVECVELLLEDVEAQRGGPEFLSEALGAVSLLLRHCSSFFTIERWCKVLEDHCLPHVSEGLRMACAEALTLAGVSLLNQRPNQEKNAVMIRLVSISLHLLQDQSVHIRVKAAYFASMLKHTYGTSQGRISVMQMNKALPFLLHQLTEQCWDSGAFDVLLSHLPQTDLRSVQRNALQNGCVTLYEQDEANVFSEPSVMCAQVLPYLLRIADKYSQSPSLEKHLNTWVKETGPQVLEDLQVCKELSTGDMQTWLTLLIDAHFHSTLCGMFTQAVLLMRLRKLSKDLPVLCEPSTLQQAVHASYCELRENGVHFPHSLSAAVVGEPSK
ncbi:thyroid adenoma-associated protein homolog [Periophthalmus magnuspinnatus]|uniref:thyroid adenoma-associated protein homolog n=1 Tax=Periophthalmus magnuspinnatus TaxID=409849 RepID=UPI002436C4FD|nr:thyroid adenoma-associated protein homolog [Periophthalmus magnuspinnatus]